MKKNLLTLALALFASLTMNAMDYETARERAYYLTDKMAYELNLNDQQYNDAFEINLDYLLSLNTEADLEDARYLTYRNEDLRHILYDWQWTTFAAASYLFRPVWWLSGGWYFPIYRYYAHGYYFYNRPSIFWNYRGGHGRFYYSGGFYLNRRPHWQGGLRGMHHHMVGHPNPGGGRYGQPGGGVHDTRGNFGRGHDNGRNHNAGGTRGYHFERNGNQHNGNQHNGNAGTHHDNTIGNHNGNDHHSTATQGGSSMGNHRDSNIGGSRHNGGSGFGTRSHDSGTRSGGSSLGGGSRSSVGGSRSGGSSFSGSRSSMSGSRSGGFSSGSRGGGSHNSSSRGGSSRGGSSRGGGRR